MRLNLILERVLPPNHPNIISVRNNLKEIEEKLNGGDEVSKDKSEKAFVDFLGKKAKSGEKILFEDMKELKILFDEFMQE